MAIAVSKSDRPLFFDTLPALKVRHYTGTSRYGDIYTMARLYFLQSDLAVSLAAFERAPDPESRVAFCLKGEGAHALRLEVSATTASLILYNHDRQTALAPPEPTYFSSSDEQGWAWGAELLVPARDLAFAGVSLAQSDAFCATLVKYRTDETAFGLAFPPADQSDPFSPLNFAAFTVVAY